MATWTERFRAAAEFASAAWGWLVLVGLVAAVLLLARSCNGKRAAEAEVRRLKEASELERQGFLVAQRTSQGELEAQAAQIPALQGEIQRLTKALGKKPSVITVERIVTVAALAEGAPRPEPAPGTSCPPCLLAEGDTGEIRVNSAHLETSKGNEVVALSAECWRLTPAPETRILAGTANAPVSRVLVEAPDSKPGWGGGIAGGIGTTGLLGTAFALTPTLGGHLSAIGMASLGPGRDGIPPLVAGQIGIAWR
jgi:hypothetical protein